MDVIDKKNEKYYNIYKMSEQKQWFFKNYKNESVNYLTEKQLKGYVYANPKIIDIIEEPSDLLKSIATEREREQLAK